MEKFKIGDEISPIDSSYGVSKEKKYKVVGTDYEGDPEIVNDTGKKDCYEACDFRLILRNGKAFKENLIRYMVYGDECDNKSELYTTESEMARESRACAKNDEWTGDIIGYKLTPLFKVEVKATLKRLDNKPVKKKAKK